MLNNSHFQLKLLTADIIIMLKTLFSVRRLIQRHNHSFKLLKSAGLFCTNSTKDSTHFNYASAQTTQQTKAEKSNTDPQQQVMKRDKQTKEQKPQQKNKDNNVDKQQIAPKFFSQIDIRIGEITECWKHPQSQNLYCEKINVRSEIRQIASGLQKYVPFEQMKGKVLVMINLKPRPLAGFTSNGMVVCASSEDHSRIELIVPQGQIGQRVFLENYQDLFAEGGSLPILNPKKKVLERSLQHFKTDEQGYVVWKGIKVMTKSGPLKTSIKNGRVS